MGTSPTTWPLYKRVAELLRNLTPTLLGFLIVMSRSSVTFNDTLGGRRLTVASKSLTATEMTVVIGFLGLKTVRARMRMVKATSSIAAMIIDKQIHLRRLRLRLSWSGSSTFFSTSILGRKFKNSRCN
ncbi:hypothetical protein Hanom_Chr12g01138711 [Helianthus anomalus]